MSLATCPTCDFMVERDWETCRYCRAPLDGSPGGAPEWAGAPGRQGPSRTASAPRPSSPGGGRLGLVLLLVVAILGAGGYVVTQKLSGPPAYPDQWDPRVAGLVAFIEQTHKMPFKHPVHVEFLPGPEFEAEVEAYVDDTSEGERASWDQRLALLQAVGLAATEVTIEGGSDATGVLGIYQPDKQTLLVRGAELNPFVAETAVHELTHALHDQYYDLGRITFLPGDGQAEMLDALTEGDAERMAMAYTASLVEGDLIVGAEAAKQVAKEMDEAFEAVKQTGLPDVLAVFGAAPYTLGQYLTEAIVASDEEAGLDAVFSDLPESAEGFMDPLTVIQRQQPVPVNVPKLGKGERRVDDGEIGPLTWYVLLAARIAPHRALEASDGWAGDAMVVYEKDGRNCVRAAFRGDTPADVDQMAGALGEWAGTLPPGAAAVTRNATGLRLDACDRGASPPPRGPEVLQLPLFRSWFLSQLFGLAPPERIDCVVDQAIARTDFAALVDPEAPAPAWVDDFTPLILACTG